MIAVASFVGLIRNIRQNIIDIRPNTVRAGEADHTGYGSLWLRLDLCLGLDMTLRVVWHSRTWRRCSTLTWSWSDTVRGVKSITWKTNIKNRVMGGINVHREKLSVEIIFRVVCVMMLLGHAAHLLLRLLFHAHSTTCSHNSFIRASWTLFLALGTRARLPLVICSRGAR